MIAFLKYYFSAQTKYKVHSPFVYEFIEDVLEDERQYHFFSVIENYRRNILADTTKIGNTSVAQLARTAGIKPKIGEILFKTVHLYKPNTLLEIGTNLGIATLYQATPNPHVPLITLEKNKAIAKQTKAFFQKLGTRNIEVLGGDQATNLAKAIAKLQTLEYVFFNGNWKKEALLSCFEQCLPYFVPNSIVVFHRPHADDTHATIWETLKAYPQIRLSIDLYEIGLLFFRSEQRAIAHFKLIENWKKPWAIF